MRTSQSGLPTKGGEGNEAGHQDALYRCAVEEFGPGLARLASGYERNVSLREDLLQEIHLALWKSLAAFAGNCSLRTWVYRVAHNTAATHALRQKRQRRDQWVSVEELEGMPDAFSADRSLETSSAVEKIGALVQTLRTIDRDVLLLYLEGFQAKEIAEIVGVSASLVSQKVHRAKKVLKRQLLSGDNYGQQ